MNTKENSKLIIRVCKLGKLERVLAKSMGAGSSEITSRVCRRFTVIEADRFPAAKVPDDEAVSFVVVEVCVGAAGAMNKF